ncbi:Na(+)/H(+) exchange regulatory cofactor NHE-RF1 [Fopius arisanus]|uniref:Na(+)/H(+) exchange regulatory cofactor NHE-RF1 n=1 Tax=Fopius arisanus TaxID=64838 RepID=A0A0C9RF04_9HYME|nr:PREDICTED: Na(+)/H(+) exchange regulatory cofactor NHE-RF1 [Fopius arisanus]XP_011312546.1 PREDICTED: Na(+)/H(+) exchange regulatory cofactor NHE-RF1 [Fopius arisanus]
MSLKDDKVPCARLCHIVKWDDFDGYGFNLHAERGKNGQFIGKVDDGSPSQAAGLRQGDRIIEVNEINIANETHKQVVDRIKAFPNETKLLVVDQEADDYYKANNVIIRGTMTCIKVIKTPERNPATENEEKADGSISSIDENMQKSIGSNDTSNSGSTVPTTASMNDENSRPHENTQENGRKSSEDDEVAPGVEHIDDISMTGNGTVPATKKGLNLKMSAKELRAKLAARKKYDPKKESIGFKDKFDIVQKL